MELPKIPLLGSTGLLAIVGFVVGVFLDKVLAKMAETNEWLSGQVAEGVLYADLINMGLPLVLLVLIKKFRPLFIGWFLGAIASNVIDFVAQQEF